MCTEIKRMSNKNKARMYKTIKKLTGREVSQPTSSIKSKETSLIIEKEYSKGGLNT